MTANIHDSAIPAPHILQPSWIIGMLKASQFCETRNSHHQTVPYSL
jgi:hypothetical protein